MVRESLDFGGLYDFEANKIHDHLWQGSCPPVGPHVGEAGFGFLVLCASEYQPPGKMFPGVDVWHSPFNDIDYRPSRETLKIALGAADRAVRHIRRGENVLVTCYAGVNRSSLVTALTIHKLLGLAGDDLIELIRLQRPNTLTNESFCDCLRRLRSRTGSP